MKQLLTLALVASAVSLGACSSMGDGQTYPAPYAHERTAGSVEYSAPAAKSQPVFEKRMTK